MKMSRKKGSRIAGTRKNPVKVVAVSDQEVSMLVNDLSSMIEGARQQVAFTANAALTTLYWQLGHRVLTEVTGGQRAEYGGQIVSAVGRQLEARYGRGFG